MSGTPTRSTNSLDKSAKRMQDSIIDMAGTCTGTPVNRRLLFSAAAGVALFILLSLLPLEKYGENTALALAFLLSSVFLMVTLPVNIAVTSLMIAVVGVCLGFWDYGTIGSVFGSSSFLSIFGMLTVAMGCEFTPLGKRISYWVLCRFGHNPKKMVVILGITAAVLSAFVSNVAVIIMMSSICAELLSAMGQKPGESRLGKTLMLVIPMTAIVGGIVLINGSPTGNTMAITLVSNATDGMYTVSYSQWAIFGVSCFVVSIVPMCLVYIGCCGLKNGDIDIPPTDYYRKLIRELGPMVGSEIRWIVIVAGMVACMLAGVNTGLAALGFACISMLPGVGVVPAVKAIKKLPLPVMISSGFVPLLAKLFTDTGLGNCMGDWIGPLVGGFGPLGFSMITALITGLLVNIFVNANVAVLALVMGVVTPVCVGLGYNPAVVLIPSMFNVSFFFVMGSHNIMLLNNGYGYWSMKDPIIPGLIVVLMSAVIFPLVCCFIGPLFGMSLYI